MKSNNQYEFVKSLPRARMHFRAILPEGYPLYIDAPTTSELRADLHRLRIAANDGPLTFKERVEVARLHEAAALLAGINDTYAANLPRSTNAAVLRERAREVLAISREILLIAGVDSADLYGAFCTL